MPGTVPLMSIQGLMTTFYTADKTEGDKAISMYGYQPEDNEGFAYRFPY